MAVIVTDTGFGQEDWGLGFQSVGGPVAANACGFDVTSDAEVDAISDYLGQTEMIRVAFPSFADGRGFTLGQRLRQMGYDGRLRAAGHVLADQYAMARRSGFDEVEISDDLAARQPEDQWLARAKWQDHDYQARLRG